MNDRAIVQGALMAITAQNVSPRAAPNSTTLMQGMVINRNIAAGETVCCYEYTGAELLRIGDDPAQTGSYWVDDENKLYEYDNTNHKILIIDGLSGAEISNTDDAYGIKILQGCCAFKVDNSTETWRFYFPDGHYSDDILLPGTAGMCYHNGYIGCGVAANQYGQVYILDTSGNTLLHQTLTVYNNRVDFNEIVPITPTEAFINAKLQSGFGDPYSRMAVVTSLGATWISVWQDYTTYSTGTIGADQSYYYGWARLADGNSQPLDEWVVVRWPLDGSDDTETVASFTSEISFIGSPTNYGTIRMTQDGATALYDISTMGQLYEDVLPTVPTNYTGMAENAGFLWIPGAEAGNGGVWQKMTLGWLMYPTAVYPRSSPYGRLGYAVRNAKIGTNGLAVVLFE